MIGLTMGLVCVLFASAGAHVINTTLPISSGGGGSGAFISPPACLPDFGLGGWITFELIRGGIIQNLINTDTGEMKVSSILKANVWWDPQDEDQNSPDRAQATHTGQGAINFTERLPRGNHQVPVSMTIDLSDASGNIIPITFPLTLFFGEEGAIGFGFTFAITCL